MAKTVCSQADIRNPLSLLAHNQIAATQLIRRGLPLLIQGSPHTCLLLFAIEAGVGTSLIWLKKDRVFAFFKFRDKVFFDSQ